MADSGASGLPTANVDELITPSSGNETEKKVGCSSPSQAQVSRPSEIAPRRTGKRGRKPARIDTKARLERSRQSARECRARKKLRYQYVEELVTSREKAIEALRTELQELKHHCTDLDNGDVHDEVKELARRRTEARTSDDVM